MVKYPAGVGDRASSRYEFTFFPFALGEGFSQSGVFVSCIARLCSFQESFKGIANELHVFHG